jgi:predicted metal-dependent HD superfamily phosphohydrolase
MRPKTSILRESRAYVRKLLGSKLEPWVAYHDYRHTAETFRACREIGRAAGLGKEDLEIALLAALFHDAGYTETVKGHEKRGAVIAARFLRSKGYPAKSIRGVRGAILATTMPQRPRNLVEAVVCDADMIYVGTKEFFRKNDLLREEIEGREEIVVEPRSWLRHSLEFLQGQTYHTVYCRSRLSAGLKRNIGTLRKRLERLGR